jgi:hypothetical protein
VCVASICRILALKRNTEGNDATWTMAPVFIWSCVEPFVGIICACLPTFGHFFRRWWAVVRTRSGGSSNNKTEESAASKTATWIKRARKKPAKDSLFSTVNDFGCVDEVHLMNDINGSRSMKEGAGDSTDVEQQGSITVKQDVDVSWAQKKGQYSRFS